VAVGGVAAPIAERQVAAWDDGRQPFAIVTAPPPAALFEDRKRVLVASLQGATLVLEEQGRRGPQRLPTGLDHPSSLLPGQDRRLLMAVDGDAFAYMQLNAGPGWPSSPQRVELPEQGLRVLGFRSAGSGLALAVGDDRATWALRINPRGRVLARELEIPVRARTAAFVADGLVCLTDDGQLRWAAPTSKAGGYIEAVLGSIPADSWRWIDVDSGAPGGETIALVRSSGTGAELYVVTDSVRSVVLGEPADEVQVVRALSPRAATGLVAERTRSDVRLWPIADLEPSVSVGARS
jgi:hypothetical protein